MRIEPVVDDIEQVPEDLRENYFQDEASGSFKLALTVNNEGELENVASLKKALDVERKTRREFKQEIATLKEGLGDADAITLKKQLLEAEGALESMRAALASAVADSAIADAIAKARGVPVVLDPVLRQFIKTSPDGTVQVLDEAGGVRVNEEGEPVSVEILVNELRETPEYAGAFLGSGNSGTGTSGSDEASIRVSATTAGRRSKMSNAEKVAYIGQHGREVYLRLPY